VVGARPWPRGIRLLPAVKVRRLAIALCVGLASVLVAGCGVHNKHFADANNIGSYIHAGPLAYQLQVSRQLNQYLPEDSEYIRGLPKGTTLPSNMMWFGVFLWAQNTTDKTQSTATNFDIVDTQGNVYRPVKLDPKVNPYAWTSQPIAPGNTQPNPSSTSGYGPAGGDLLLFKLPAVGKNSIFDNRPLTLQIRTPSGSQILGTISLDL
jgi:hypothetical protein